MKTYKIWVEVEEYDDETDEHQNLDQLNAGFHVGNDAEAALVLAGRLHIIGQELANTYDDGVDAGKKQGRRVRNVNRAVDTPS